MDETDEKLVSLLRGDSRMALSDLAALLNLSRTTVRQRLSRLRSSGEIVGFSVVTRADVRPDPVRGMMMIGIEGRGASRITRQLQQMAQVRAVHSTNGRWDIIVEIGTETLDQLDAVLARIRELDGIVASETNLLLKPHKAG